MYQIRSSKSSFTQNLKLSITQTHLDLCRYILHKIKYVAVFGQYGTSSTSNHQLYDVIKLYSLMLKISSEIPKLRPIWLISQTTCPLQQTVHTQV